MGVFEDTKNAITHSNDSYGHIHTNKDNTQSLLRAKEELEAMLQKQKQKEPFETGDFVADLERWRDLFIAHRKRRNITESSLLLIDRTLVYFIDFVKKEGIDISLREIDGRYYDMFIEHLSLKAKSKGKKVRDDGFFISKSTRILHKKHLIAFFKYISIKNADDFKIYFLD